MDFWKKCVVLHIININIVKCITHFLKKSMEFKGHKGLHLGYLKHIIDEFDNCNKKNEKSQT